MTAIHFLNVKVPAWLVGVLVAGVLAVLYLWPRGSSDVPELLAASRQLRLPSEARVSGRIEFLTNGRLMSGFAFRANLACQDVVKFYRQAASDGGFSGEASGVGNLGGPRYLWTRGRFCMVVDCAREREQEMPRRFVVYVARGWFGSSVCRATGP